MRRDLRTLGIGGMSAVDAPLAVGIRVPGPGSSLFSGTVVFPWTPVAEISRPGHQACCLRALGEVERLLDGPEAACCSFLAWVPSLEAGALKGLRLDVLSFLVSKL